MGMNLESDPNKALLDLIQNLAELVALMSEKADQKTIPVAEYGDTLILECDSYLSAQESADLSSGLDAKGIKAIILAGGIKLAGIQAVKVAEDDSGLYMDGSRQ